VVLEVDNFLGAAQKHLEPPFVQPEAILTQRQADTQLLEALSAHLQAPAAPPSDGWTVCYGIFWGEFTKKQSFTWESQPDPPPLPKEGTSTGPLVHVYTGALVKEGNLSVLGQGTSPMSLQFGQLCNTTSGINFKNRSRLGDTNNEWDTRVIDAVKQTLVVGAVVVVNSIVWVMVAPFKFGEYDVEVQSEEGDTTVVLRKGAEAVSEKEIWPNEFQTEWFLVHASCLKETQLKDGSSRFLDSRLQKYFTRGMKAVFTKGLVPYELLGKGRGSTAAAAPEKVHSHEDGFDRDFCTLLRLDPTTGKPLTPFFKRLVLPVYMDKMKDTDHVQAHIAWLDTIFATQTLVLKDESIDRRLRPKASASPKAPENGVQGRGGKPTGAPSVPVLPVKVLEAAEPKKSSRLLEKSGAAAEGGQAGGKGGKSTNLVPKKVDGQLNVEDMQLELRTVPDEALQAVSDRVRLLESEVTALKGASRQEAQEPKSE
jgi:hypothetical protein